MFKVSESFLLSSKYLVMRPSEFFVSLLQFCFKIVRSSEGSLSVCLVLCLGHSNHRYNGELVSLVNMLQLVNQWNITV